ncbi:hypothetical protein L596_013419 [Steinernema carpocapsae]|uniref:Uncharacterized protein n=1 Tax=Steinernema carpocapsae TaxID=34508 RepID=A0A4U5P088_STECR|nr:hypothetical protein L596_013419 [Steinernema carpocapsae]
MPNMIKTDEAAHFPGFICYLWRCLGMYTATMKLMMFPKVMCVSFYDVPYNVKKRSSNVTLTAKARMAFCWESVEMGTEYKLYLLETGETVSIKRADWLKNKV